MVKKTRTPGDLMVDSGRQNGLAGNGLKLNTEAEVRDNKLGVGAVVRDHGGVVVAAWRGSMRIFRWLKHSCWR